MLQSPFQQTNFLRECLSRQKVEMETAETTKAPLMIDFIAGRNWFNRFVRLEGPSVTRRRTFVCHKISAVSRRHQTVNDTLLNEERKTSNALEHAGGKVNRARCFVMPQNCAVEVQGV
jgi:hypothetical protein